MSSKIELPEIRYDYPKGHSNPFDRTTEDRYFISAQGFTNLTNNLEDFQFDLLAKEIPMGYKSLAICQRICLIGKGQIIKKWKYDEFDNVPQRVKGKWIIHSNKKRKAYITEWKREIESNAILRETKDGSIYSYLWESIDQAENLAKELSNKEDITLMISRILEFHDWH